MSHCGPVALAQARAAKERVEDLERQLADARDAYADDLHGLCTDAGMSIRQLAAALGYRSPNSITRLLGRARRAPSPTVTTP